MLFRTKATHRRRRRAIQILNPMTFSSICLFVVLSSRGSEGFASHPVVSSTLALVQDGNRGLQVNARTFASTPLVSRHPKSRSVGTAVSPATSRTALNVWWFGGTESGETVGEDDESCELVAVRIERTSANSRRISGEITVPVALETVWGILTDYNQLATHVPNVVESRIVATQSAGRNGDGSFQCRLYQKGAQKIIGFEFGASLTMEMKESIIRRPATDARDDTSQFAPQLRRISFKCIDSQFFSGFDGDWTVQEKIGPDGELETLVSYVVDVRPKGPVPVAALEWRIREDVPTNLRSIKAASLKSLELPVSSYIGDSTTSSSKTTVRVKKSRPMGKVVESGVRNQGQQRLTPVMVPAIVDWDRDETMAKYLDK